MKRKRYIFLLLAILTIAIPTVWGYRSGVQRAETHIQAHPERFPNPEKHRADIAVHCATGGFLLGSGIVVYFVVANAFIRGFGVVFNGMCSGVGFVARKIRRKTEPQGGGYSPPAARSSKPTP